jgi:hypothetical protein
MSVSINDDTDSATCFVDADWNTGYIASHDHNGRDSGNTDCDSGSTAAVSSDHGRYCGGCTNRVAGLARPTFHRGHHGRF